MREKISFLIFLLVVGILMVNKVSSPLPTLVYVDPVRSDANAGESFNVTIKVIEARDLYTYQFYLVWHTPLLEATQCFEGDFLSEGDVRDTLHTVKTYNDRGEIKIWNVRLGGGGGVFGSGILETITFSVKDIGESGLHFDSIKLLDSFNIEIPNVVVEDGYVNVTPPMFHVDPATIEDPTLKVGESFVVNLTLTDAVEASRLSFRLYYNATLLNATNVSVVPFLKEPVVPDVDINYTIVDDMGFLWVNLTSTAPEPVNGSGPVANVTFVVQALGETILDIRDTKLDDKLARLKSPPFEHRPPAEDGYFSNIPLGHDIAVRKVTVLPTELTAGETVQINATVANMGEYDETFDVAVNHSETIEIAKQTDISLASAEKKILTFTWDTAGLKAGSYMIRVEATGVQDDAKPGNNVFTFGPITVEATQTSNIILYAGIGVGVVVVAALVLYFVKFRKPK